MSPSSSALNLRVHDVHLRVSWDDSALAAGIRTVLDHFAFTPESSSPHAPSIRIHLAARAQPLKVPSEARQLTTSQEGLQFFREGELLYIELEGAVMRLHPESGTARGTLPQALDDQRDAVLFCLFFYSAVVLLYYRDLPTMHGACLSRNGTGCLLLGESGSGKSTLALNLVRQGWDYLSDDTVLLHQTSDSVDTLPFRRDFCLVQSAIESFPELNAHGTPHLTNPRKQRIRLRRLYPDQAATGCCPKTLVFPHIVSQARSQLIPLDEKAALMQLMRHSGALAVLDAPAVARHLDLLKQLLRQSRSYRLLAGRNLKEQPEEVLPTLTPYLAGTAGLQESRPF